MSKKGIAIGAKVGGGRRPGYEWAVEYLTVAEDEARRFLNDAQYTHIVHQLQSLARERDPTHPVTVVVAKVEDFHELKDKGGPLGKINVRVFFFVRRETRVIVVLGVIKKEAEGQTPNATKRLMKRRKRKYLRGDYGVAE